LGHGKLGIRLGALSSRTNSPSAEAASAADFSTEGLKLLHNVDNFGAIRRPVEQAKILEFAFPIRGQAFGGVIK
jgi:hypothetical protein